MRDHEAVCPGCDSPGHNYRSVWKFARRHGMYQIVDKYRCKSCGGEYQRTRFVCNTPRWMS